MHGIRQFDPLAGFLVYWLRMIRPDVALLNASGFGAAEDVAAMEPSDVLISASCAPYSHEVVEVAKAACDYGLIGIALTDAASSPLVRHCKQAILVQHTSSFLSNSMVAFFAAAECLINACAAARPASAAQSLIRRETLIWRLEVEI